jgi:trk system potassium uptake protein TrkA
MLLKTWVLKCYNQSAYSLHAKVLRKIGADRIVFPERDVAERLVNSVLSPNILDVIDLSSDYNIVEIKTPKKLAGKTLKDSQIRTIYGVNVVAIKRKEPFIDDEGNTDFKETLSLSPTSEYELAEGDVLVIIENDKISKLKELS